MRGYKLDIGFICLALFAPVIFPFFPIALWVLSVMMGIILFRENQYDRDNDYEFKLCMVYFLDFIQGIIGLCIGVTVSRMAIALLSLVYALVWVIPITNPFLLGWYILKSEVDDDDDYDD